MTIDEVMTFEEVDALITRGLRGDPHYTSADVWNEIREGRATLWPGNQSTAVTTVIECPQGRRFNIWVAAGDMTELIEEIYPAMEQAARELGCRSVTITGRRGWVRALRDIGFKEAATVVAKEL